MSGDLVSLSLLLVGTAPSEESAWREGATQASILVDFDICAVAQAKVALSRGGIDVCVLDASLAPADIESLCKSARAKKSPPLIFACLKRGAARPDKVDGVLPSPRNAGDAHKLIEVCIRARMPTPVLVAADSDSLRVVVRKILRASRFDLDVHEAADGSGTLDSLRKRGFGLVFLDTNMPALNGAEILQAIKRARPNVSVVMMSGSGRSTAEPEKAAKALALLKKPFYPADVDAVLERYFGLTPPK
jgi:DNA-binding response OmpR family regulator